MSNPKEHSHHASHCPTCGRAHAHAHSPATSIDDEPDDSRTPPPGYLSKQSRRAFLTSLGAATALGLSQVGFRRDPAEAKADLMAMADTVRDAGNLHILKATPQNCFWGYFDRDQPPVLSVNSGDIIYVEALTHHAGDAPDLLMDDGVRAVYEQITDRGPGVHIMTGPIEVKGAEPGDTLMVRILKTQPRLPYGSNIAAHWGYLYDTFKKERITIYKLDFEANLARPEFAFDFKARPKYDTPGFISTPKSTAVEIIV